MNTLKQIAIAAALVASLGACSSTPKKFDVMGVSKNAHLTLVDSMSLGKAKTAAIYIGSMALCVRWVNRYVLALARS